jgi:hypothetical protein
LLRVDHFTSKLWRNFAPTMQKSVLFMGVNKAVRSKMGKVMDRIGNFCKFSLAAAFSTLFATLILLSPAAGQEDTPGWQAIISSQINAFRQGDARGALEFAGEGFKARYDDAAAFYRDIESGGYGPILHSRAHSFGEFKQTEGDDIVQLVRIVGPDQRLYNAIYQMGMEPDGWRVKWVTLSPRKGIGV